MPNWHTLAPAAQAAQYQAWLDEASEAQVGCETHFYRSGTRLRKDPNLVAPSNRDEFDNLRRQLVSNVAKIGLRILHSMQDKVPEFSLQHRHFSDIL